MKLLETKKLAIDAVKTIKFARFCDHRGYFTETFRKSQFMKNEEFLQVNESFSRAGTVRGLHFQWNPFMGKCVRTVHGRMVDIFLDIRKGSPTFGKASLYELPSTSDMEFAEWIWVPPGFAHGNYFTEDSIIEYFCTGEYSPGCEAGISPLAEDIDWSLCDPELKKEFEIVLQNKELMTEKDINGFSVEAWMHDERSDNFLYEELS